MIACIDVSIEQNQNLITQYNAMTKEFVGSLEGASKKEYEAAVTNDPIISMGNKEDINNIKEECRISRPTDLSKLIDKKSSGLRNIDKAYDNSKPPQIVIEDNHCCCNII